EGLVNFTCRLQTIMLPAPKNTYVRRLRVRHGAREDSLLAQQGVARLLATMDFGSALPRDAIYCIRELTDPLPGRMGSPLAAAIAPEWQRAMDESLREIAARAKRPARDGWAGEANAVWFADVAELLACLARDWCGGATQGKWWWRLLFPGLNVVG